MGKNCSVTWFPYFLFSFCYHSFHHNTINFLEMCNFRCFILILSWLSLFLLLPLIDNPLKNYEIWCYLLLHAYIGFSFLYKFPFVTKVVEMEQEREEWSGYLFLSRTCYCLRSRFCFSANDRKTTHSKTLFIWKEINWF